MILSEIYTEAEKQLLLIQGEKTKLLSEMTDEYDELDYNELLFQLETKEVELKRLLKAHFFNNMSKEQYFRNDSQEELFEVYHTVRDFDTIELISSIYNVTIDDILETNQITTNDLETGKTLVVRITKESLKKEGRAIPVFGELKGEDIFGTDLPVNLEVDAKGDLKVLDPEKTLRQGVLIRSTSESGCYPGLESFGIDFKIATDTLQADVREGLFKVKIINFLLTDERIADIEEIEIEETEDAIISRGTLRAINGDPITYGDENQ